MKDSEKEFVFEVCCPGLLPHLPLSIFQHGTLSRRAAQVPRALGSPLLDENIPLSFLAPRERRSKELQGKRLSDKVQSSVFAFFPPPPWSAPFLHFPVPTHLLPPPASSNAISFLFRKGALSKAPSAYPSISSTARHLSCLQPSPCLNCPTPPRLLPPSHGCVPLLTDSSG